MQVVRTRTLLPSRQRLVRGGREGLVGAMLLYVCWWNLDDVALLRPAGALMPASARWFGYFFRTDQHWGMFAPTVFKDDGWYVL